MKKENTLQEIKRKNVLENNLEYKDEKIVLESYPPIIFVELTQNCNLSCQYCRTKNNYDPNLNMDLALFKNIANELFSKASVVDLRAWGESTILKNFELFLDITIRFEPQIRLVTNGMNMNEKIWEKLMATKSMVVISCDSPDPATFSLLRGGGNINQLIKTTETVVKYREKYSVPSSFVYFTAVVSKMTLPQIPELIKFAAKLKIHKIILFPIGIWPSHPWHIGNDKDWIVKNLENATLVANQAGVELQLGATLSEELSINQSLKNRCISPWSYLLLNYRGDIGYCDHVIGPGGNYLGQIKGNEFHKEWNNERFQNLRKKHLENDFGNEFAMCKWCYLNRYIDFEHQFLPINEELVVSNITQQKLYSNSAL
jgi:radical SAM protein with 4Fe4S-binding SPASM domain